MQRTFITAHSGSQKTKPNSREMFSALLSGKIIADGFEVDVRLKKGQLVLSHAPCLFIKNKVPLQEALLFAKEHGYFINIDIKEKGIFPHIHRLVQDLDMDKEVYYTGWTHPKYNDIVQVGNILAHADVFCKGLALTGKNVSKIKQILSSYRHIAGINLSYHSLRKDFLEEAEKQGLPLSVYTVDNPKKLQKFRNYPFFNITTHRPDLLQVLCHR